MRRAVIGAVGIAFALVLLSWWGAGSAGAAGCDGSIAYGEVVWCQVDPAGATRTLAFSGAAGATVRVRVVPMTNNLNPAARITHANSSTECAATFSDEFDCTLDTTGTHKLVVENATLAGTGSFTTTIQNLNSPSGCRSLPLSETGSSGSLEVAAELDCFNRIGNAGQRWRLRLTEGVTSSDVGVDVVRPNGSTVCAMTLAVDSTCQLDTSGVHHIFVRAVTNLDLQTYRLVVERFPAPVGCAQATIGPASALQVATAGAFECVTFNAPVGAIMRVLVLSTAAGWNPAAEVLRPEGTTACGPDVADEFSCSLDVAGLYTVLVTSATGSATGTGTLALRNLNDTASCPAVPIGMTGVAASLATQGELACFTAPGSVGQSWRLRLVETTPDLTVGVEVFRPNATQVCGSQFTDEPLCTLDADGLHVLLVHGGSTGSFRLLIQRFPDPVGCTALGFGSPVPTDLVDAGAARCFTFTAAQGVDVDGQLIKTSGEWSPGESVLHADGTVECENNGPDGFACHTDSAGTHVLWIRDGKDGFFSGGDGTGGAYVSIQNRNDPVGCTDGVFGETGVAGSFSIPAEVDCLTFTGTAGQRWRMRSVNVSGTARPGFTIREPDGLFASCKAALTHEMECVLFASGTYHAFVKDGLGRRSGTYRFIVEKFPDPTGCTPLASNGQSAPVEVTTNGAFECFTFTGTPGSTVTVSMNSTGGTWFPRTEVVRPDGTRACLAAKFVTVFQCQVDTAGQWAILVRDGDGRGLGSGTISLNG